MPFDDVSADYTADLTAGVKAELNSCTLAGSSGTLNVLRLLFETIIVKLNRAQSLLDETPSDAR